MSITRDQLGVGETYRINSGTTRKVLAIGADRVFYEFKLTAGCGEDSMSIDSFIETVYIIKPEPKKLGEVAWFRCKNGDLYPVVVNSKDFEEYSEIKEYQRVTIKNNEVWEYEDE